MTKSQAKPFNLIVILPQFKYFTISPNRYASLTCRVILNLNSTWYLEPLFVILILKLSSSAVKPDIQLESMFLNS